MTHSAPPPTPPCDPDLDPYRGPDSDSGLGPDSDSGLGPSSAQTSPSSPPLFPVALSHCPNYSQEAVDAAVFASLEASGWTPPHGCRVLVKPNLLRADTLTCTHPLVVRAACAWLLDHHCTLVVADSPGFGTAAHVAQSIGLTAALKTLGIVPTALEDPLPLSLPSAHTEAGRTQGWNHPWKQHWGVSATALHSDVILSVPKVKAHCQMRLTLSVKNLFGCVCSWRKAIAHTVQGGSHADFTAALTDLWAALPPVVALADGIIAMHKNGPSGGEAYPLGCVAASASAVALDTAFYTMLGQQPHDIPLWAELSRRHIAGSAPKDLTFPLAQSYAFDTTRFMLPQQLMDVSFQPHRLLLSLWRRWRQRYFPPSPNV